MRREGQRRALGGGTGTSGALHLTVIRADGTRYDIPGLGKKGTRRAWWQSIGRTVKRAWAALSD